MVANKTMQASLPQLSRRRRHTIFYHLEAWFERGEGIDIMFGRSKCIYSHHLDLHREHDDLCGKVVISLHTIP